MRPTIRNVPGDRACTVLAISFGLGIGWLDLRTTEVTVTVVALLLGGLGLGSLCPRRPWRWSLLLALGLPVVAATGRALGWPSAEPIQVDLRIAAVALIFGSMGAYAGAALRRGPGEPPTSD